MILSTLNMNQCDKSKLPPPPHSDLIEDQAQFTRASLMTAAIADNERAGIGKGVALVYGKRIDAAALRSILQPRTVRTLVDRYIRRTDLPMLFVWQWCWLTRLTRGRDAKAARKTVSRRL